MSFESLGVRRLARGVFLELERIHLLGPDGGSAVRDVVRHPGGVAMLPIDRRGRMWFFRQYRVAIGREVLEIPAGKLDVPGEDLETAVRRELSEELGAEGGTISALGRMLPSPGYTDEVIHLYAVDGIVAGRRRPDGLEEHHAEVVVLPVDDVMAMLDAGEIEDAKTQLALLTWSRRTE